MSKIEKLIAKIENYKSGNKIEFSDLEKYLKYFGFKKKNQNGTSHVIFTHDLLNRPFPIPKHGNSVKEVYVKKTLTIPKWLNEAACSMGLNFSQILQEALLQKVQSNY